MRGTDVTQDSMFSYLTLEDYVPEEHPLRPIREIVNAALREMAETFAAMYADSRRDSTPPEQLLRGLILQSLYGLRSERLLCEQLGYNMLFRWFVGLGVEKKPWDHFRRRLSRDQRHAARGAKHFRPIEPHRSKHDASHRIPNQSVRPQAHRDRVR